jgi:hypothetical protein
MTSSACTCNASKPERECVAILLLVGRPSHLPFRCSARRTSKMNRLIRPFVAVQSAPRKGEKEHDPQSADLTYPLALRLRTRKGPRAGNRPCTKFLGACRAHEAKHFFLPVCHFRLNQFAQTEDVAVLGLRRC